MSSSSRAGRTRPGSRPFRSPGMSGHTTGKPRETRTPGDERHRCQVPAGDQNAAGAHAEEHHEQQRPAEARGAGRSRRDRERQEGDGVDEPERDDGEDDRLEPELDAGHPAQRRDLDDVVQPEREDHAAGRGGAAGRQAADPTGTAGDGEELLPTERPEARSSRSRASRHHPRGPCVRARAASSCE